MPSSCGPSHRDLNKETRWRLMDVRKRSAISTSVSPLLGWFILDSSAEGPFVLLSHQNQPPLPLPRPTREPRLPPGTSVKGPSCRGVAHQSSGTHTEQQGQVPLQSSSKQVLRFPLEKWMVSDADGSPRYLLGALSASHTPNPMHPSPHTSSRCTSGHGKKNKKS